jgi:hypothetical protein
MPEISEPAVVRAMREYRDGILARDERQMRDMTKRWLTLEDNLAAQIELTARQVADLKAVGGNWEGKARMLDRYKTLFQQTQRELESYAEYATTEVSRGQAEMARFGITQSAEAIKLSGGMKLGTAFDRLPVDAVLGMVGMAGNGQPLGELLMSRVKDPALWEKVTQTLMSGTALGWNPVKTARAMADDLTGGLQNALLIARTEQMRVYRQASLDQAEKSGVVSGHIRMSAHDGRVCAACLALDGTVIKNGEAFGDHPGGRCCVVPVVDMADPPRWTAGEAWFREQDEGMQREILGPGRFELWKGGKLEFGKLAVHTHDPVWGAGVRMATMGELGYSVSDVRGMGNFNN